MPNRYRYALRISPPVGKTLERITSDGKCYELELAEYTASIQRDNFPAETIIEIVRAPEPVWETVRSFISPSDCIGRFESHDPERNRYGAFCSRCGSRYESGLAAR